MLRDIFCTKSRVDAPSTSLGLVELYPELRLYVCVHGSDGEPVKGVAAVKQNLHIILLAPENRHR